MCVRSAPRAPRSGRWAAVHPGGPRLRPGQTRIGERDGLERATARGGQKGRDSVRNRGAARTGSPDRLRPRCNRPWPSFGGVCAGLSAGAGLGVGGGGRGAQNGARCDANGQVRAGAFTLSRCLRLLVSDGVRASAAPPLPYPTVSRVLLMACELDGCGGWGVPSAAPSANMGAPGPGT